MNLKGCVKNNEPSDFRSGFPFIYFTGKDLCMCFAHYPSLVTKLVCLTLHWPKQPTKLLNVYQDNNFLYTVNRPTLNVKFLLFMRCLSKVNRIVIFGSVRSDETNILKDYLQNKMTIFL